MSPLPRFCGPVIFIVVYSLYTGLCHSRPFMQPSAVHCALALQVRRLRHSMMNQVHLWRSRHNLRELALAFAVWVLVLHSGHQAPWQAPLPLSLLPGL